MSRHRLSLSFPQTSFALICSLFREINSHSSPSHLQFFAHWDRLLDLEQDAESSNIAKAWQIPSLQQELETRTAISNLSFDSTYFNKGDDDCDNNHNGVILKFAREDSPMSQGSRLSQISDVASTTSSR